MNDQTRNEAAADVLAALSAGNPDDLDAALAPLDFGDALFVADLLQRAAAVASRRAFEVRRVTRPNPDQNPE